MTDTPESEQDDPIEEGDDEHHSRHVSQSTKQQTNKRQRQAKVCSIALCFWFPCTPLVMLCCVILVFLVRSITV